MINRQRTAAVLAAAATVLLGGAPAGAEVTSVEPGAFATRNRVVVKADVARAYAALLAPAAWWSPSHTWSGKAENLSLGGKAGDCFCERLAAGGAVEHARVVYADPAGTLRLNGALGPLQSMAVVGVLTWTFKTDPAGGTVIEQTYKVGGRFDMDTKALAPAVDGVMAEQVARLGRWLDTGKPGV